MKKIIYATIFVTLLLDCGGVSAADKASTFTIKGRDGMRFTGLMWPKECMKKVNKVWQQLKSCKSSVEPILLNFGPAFTFTKGELIVDLLDEIKKQAKENGSAEYPISGYGVVCVALALNPKPAIWKCAPIGGSVNFN